ncbi:DUF550 domain-containing protein [Salmonella enterica]|nr:DUF550 domain-containing protein [Salmonella enterica]EBS4439647.1 DUF550 domain-containing protein [Salmonella enterica subsp. enterica serovar Guinea]EHG6518977.1 DUF550 domain-containing protein [Salmonella enterica subsp. enterica serovar 44:z10:1,7]MLX01824.1 DUF550 domain-containing protein [Salmonella enterica subsp. enterica serovar Kalina]EAM7579065.1 DUF550 domain-containing protein [Salmonella enterica]
MTTITKEWLQQTIAEFENTRDDIPFGLDDDDAKILIVLKRALASLEREQVRHEHADWSDATFGDVGPIGPLKHLSKEALETAAEPGDLSEWADMQFLLWDAQRRAGITDKQITLAMVEKLAVNKKRKWPEPKDGEPRLHIKEQPVPVVPEECPAELPYAQVKAAADLYALCWQSGEVVTYTPAPEKATIWLNNYSGTCVQEYVKLERLQEALSGYSPVIPDDWVMVPKKLTAENGAKSLLSGEFLETTFISCPECFADEECESCDGSGRIKIEVPVSWTTIKAIWNKGVEHFRSSTATGDN